MVRPQDKQLAERSATAGLKLGAKIHLILETALGISNEPLVVMAVMIVRR